MFLASIASDRYARLQYIYASTGCGKMWLSTRIIFQQSKHQALLEAFRLH